MCSNGQTLKLLLLICFFLASTVSADESGGWIAMPGQLEENYAENSKNEDNDKKIKKSGFISPGNSEYLGGDYTKESPFFSNKENQKFALDDEELIGGTNIQVPGVTGINSFKNIDNEKILQRAKGQWGSAFSFSYVRDSYDYKDRNGIFDSVYRDGANSKNYGTFLLKFREKIGSIFYYGVNTGFGYNTGRGFFIPDGTIIQTPTESNVEFKMYSVPLELSIGFKFNIGKYFNLNVNAAPGVMGIWQHRDDREQQDDSKNIRQIGFGYSAEAGIGINISRMSGQFGVDLLSDYKVSNMSLDIFARNQSYNNFKQADFEISGLSFGLGFTFDYL